eukprot:1180972-Prorocentrum_minimum.AAC.1
MCVILLSSISISRAATCPLRVLPPGGARPPRRAARPRSPAPRRRLGSAPPSHAPPRFAAAPSEANQRLLRQRKRHVLAARGPIRGCH